MTRITGNSIYVSLKKNHTFANVEELKHNTITKFVNIMTKHANSEKRNELKNIINFLTIALKPGYATCETDTYFPLFSKTITKNDISITIEGVYNLLNQDIDSDFTKEDALKLIILCNDSKSHESFVFKSIRSPRIECYTEGAENLLKELAIDTNLDGLRELKRQFDNKEFENMPLKGRISGYTFKVSDTITASVNEADILGEMSNIAQEKTSAVKRFEGLIKAESQKKKFKSLVDFLIVALRKQYSGLEKNNTIILKSKVLIALKKIDSQCTEDDVKLLLALCTHRNHRIAPINKYTNNVKNLFTKLNISTNTLELTKIKRQFDKKGFQGYEFEIPVEDNEVALPRFPLRESININYNSTFNSQLSELNPTDSLAKEFDNNKSTQSLDNVEDRIKVADEALVTEKEVNQIEGIIQSLETSFKNNEGFIVDMYILLDTYELDSVELTKRILPQAKDHDKRLKLAELIFILQNHVQFYIDKISLDRGIYRPSGNENSMLNPIKDSLQLLKCELKAKN